MIEPELDGMPPRPVTVVTKYKLNTKTLLVDTEGLPELGDPWKISESMGTLAKISRYTKNGNFVIEFLIEEDPHDHT